MSSETRARALNVWAGRLVVAICILHLAYFTIETWHQWAGWAAGDLRGMAAINDADANISMQHFWALPGSFMIPLAILGLLISREARAGRALPGYVGWALLAWIVLCNAIIFPSGFLLGFIPAIMLIVAHRIEVRRAR